MFDAVDEFLTNDLKLSIADLAEAKALLAQFRGDEVEAAYHWYQAGRTASCRKIITNHALPLLASCDVSTYQSTLKKLSFLAESNEHLQPFGAFFEMLRIIEDVKAGKCDNNVFSTLERIVDFLVDKFSDFADSRRRDQLMKGFVARKIEEGKAMVQFNAELDME